MANALDKPVDATLTVFTNWGIPVLGLPLKLKAREVWTADLQDWLTTGNLSGRARLSAGDLADLRAQLSGQASVQDGLFYGTAGAHGRAAGYITLRTKAAKGAKARPDALRGESFLVDPTQGPARGDDLTDVDPATATRVCFRQVVRHKSGTGLAGARVILWREMAGQILPAPVAADRRRPVDVSVFNAAGQLVRTHQLRLLPIEQVALAQLGLTEPLGRVEITSGDASVAAVLASENGPVLQASCSPSGPGPGNQPQVRIATLVNGQDANTAPGPKIAAGAAINWQYQVSNTGTGALNQIRVTDGQGASVSCPKNTLAPGQAMTCTVKALAAVCQQRNVGTVKAVAVKGKKRTNVTAQDAAHYFGDEGSAIEIVVSTNGQDANDPEGPHVQAGSRVDWSYLVRNTGGLRLYEVAVKDDRGAVIVCPRVSLAPGETMTCAANGIAVPGQFRNKGTATAKGTCGPIADDDVSHYFGETDTGLSVRVLTNGYDGDFPPGPSISVDSPVTWEYVVTNTGKLNLNTLQAANDRNVAVSCPATTLAPGRSMTCRVQGVAASCQQSHHANVSGRTSEGQPVSASDQSHYFGAFQAAVTVEMSVNGSDADLPPGPSVVTGGSVQWIYQVTNTGKAGLTAVQVGDDQGAAVVCPKTELRPGESMSCRAGGAALSGDFRSVATVTAQPPCGSPVSANDPSHYRGVGDPGIRIQTKTNGQDANAPPGPSIPIGSAVRWEYVVTNTGQLGLSAVAVTDSRGAGVSCPKAALRAGEAMTCLAEGAARACQQDTLGTATGKSPDGQLLTAVDPSYYYGQPDASLRIETATNGVDADAAPGPTIRVGAAVTWTYAVTNDGNVDLTGVQVSDDQGALVVCPASTLAAGETMICTARGTAAEGQFVNNGTVAATTPCGPRLTASDPSHYFGSGEGSLEIRKYTNNQDANEPPGPTIPVGQPVAWTYRVTNTGTAALSTVAVTDSRGVNVVCPKTTLQPAETMTCLGTGTAQACQYDNLGIATGTTVGGQQVSAVDLSYYFGAGPISLSLEARVNGQVAASPPGPGIAVGSAVAWTYAVTNSGESPLFNVRVTDESGMLVSCPKTTLQPRELMTCSAAGTAREGIVRNGATAKGDPACGPQVSAQAASYYSGGGASTLQIRKLTNGQESAQAPGPSIPVGNPIVWSYVVANSGQVGVSQIQVTDDDPAVTVVCPRADLQPGQSMTCTARGTAQACQYVNVGTVRGWNATGQVVAAAATGYYTGEPAAGIRILTATNGYQADNIPGPTVLPGSSVTWTYTVINTGNVALGNVLVIDNQGPPVTCLKSVLQPGESMLCTASGIADEGQYSNIGSVTATPACGAQVSAENPSHYFGGGNAGLAIETRVNGTHYDAPPGLQVPAGQGVSWTHRVTNSGQVALSGVAVTDSRGVNVICPKSTLQPGEVMTCTGGGTGGGVPACQISVLGTATGRSASGQQVSAVDEGYAFGQIQPAVTLETRVNGQDADQAPGPTLQVGSSVTWAYVVKNTGNSSLANVTIGDDLAGDVSCPKAALQPGEQMTCYALGTATVGAHATQGTVTADPPCGSQVSAADGTHYFGGGTPGLAIRKLTNGQDLPWPGATVPAGQPVVWTYVATNSGLLPLTGVAVTDDDPPVTVTCPRNSLLPGESITCTSSRGTARACSYLNIATATAQSSNGPVSAADPSFYTGSFQAGIQIETRVNGRDADTPPGETIPGGSPVAWTYVVTNTSSVPLTGILVRDDQGQAVSCPASTLAANQSMTCSASGLAALGQAGNVGIVTGNPPCGAQVSAQDPSYYVGSSVSATLALQITTNGQESPQAPGPSIPVGSAIVWSYVVANSGQVGVSQIQVTDDDPAVTVVCPRADLQPGQSMTCTARGTAQACQYVKVGTVRGWTSTGQAVASAATSYYYGAPAPGIRILTATNGYQADNVPGPTVLPGSSVTWTYTVINTGNVALGNVLVIDNQGPPVTCLRTVLQPGESMLCTASGIADEGQYSNVGSVTATPTCGAQVSAQDPSHYFGGGDAGIAIETRVNGTHYDAPPGLQVPAGQGVSWSHRVTNGGQVALSTVAVTDSRGVNVTCPKSTLQPGEVMTCTGGGTGGSVPACQISTLGTATGRSASGQQVSAVDESYAFGQIQPAVTIETRVNGQDADQAPGPTLQVGSSVTWAYVVKNTGNSSLANVTIGDDLAGDVSCPKATLQPGEQMTCYALGTATVGTHSTQGTVTADPPCGPQVSAADPTHYFGGGTPGLEIRKLTNGQDLPWPGATIPVGQSVAWTYVATNSGLLPLTGVSVTDDDPTVTVTCPRNSLLPGESITCTSSRGTARACGYLNIATATAQSSNGPVSAADPSFYTGSFQAGIQIETRVNGKDADTPPGESIPGGSPVTWTYIVTNTSSVPLTGILVRDDQGQAVSCPSSALAANQSMTCSANGLAALGQAGNVGVVTGIPPCGSQVTAQDPSYYFGAGTTATLALQITTNGQESPQAPGPSIPVGNPIVWTYVVANSGQVGVSQIQVTDDDPAVTVVCPGADLQPGQSMTCTARGTAQPCQHSNIGMVRGWTAAGQGVAATATRYYSGVPAAGIRILTATNGYQADNVPGPTILPGSAVTWTYTVINTGNVALGSVLVIDSQGPPVICLKTVLQPGESMVCTASGIADEGQYSNVGSVTAAPACGAQVSAQDPSHYFGGGDAGLAIETRVNGVHYDAPPGLQLPVGQSAAWTYRVTNSGQVVLSGVAATDSRGVNVTCPKTTLQPGEVMTCTGGGTGGGVPACQISVLGMATGRSTSGQQVSAVDEGYTFGQIQPAVTLETRVNGQDSDQAPGPTLQVGSTVTWVYVVKITGNSALANVTVGDDLAGNVDCPKTALQTGEQMTCYALGTATAGGHSTQGTVTADPPCGSQISAADNTHYFGGGTPGLEIRKLTNGQDLPWPGATIPAGQPVVWTYIATNTGLLPLTSVVVTDDDPTVTVTCPRNSLLPGESITCTSSRGTSKSCSYLNIATVTAQSTNGAVSAADPSFYTGSFQAGIQIETKVNGKDADTSPGDNISFGSPVTWTYLVTNTSSVPLTSVLVRDNQGVAVTCPSSTLAAGQTMTCTASGIAATGQASNVGIVTANPPCGAQVTAQDPAYYFGTLPVSIDIQKLTNDRDVAQPSGLFLVIGSSVKWKYNIRNTGQVQLTNIAVADDKGVAVNCPRTTLQPGELMTCTGSGIAVAGDYSNTGSGGAPTPDPTTGSYI